jgi:hypothetical protein
MRNAILGFGGLCFNSIIHGGLLVQNRSSNKIKTVRHLFELEESFDRFKLLKPAEQSPEVAFHFFLGFNSKFGDVFFGLSRAKQGDLGPPPGVCVWALKLNERDVQKNKLCKIQSYHFASASSLVRDFLSFKVDIRFSWNCFLLLYKEFRVRELLFEAELGAEIPDLHALFSS